LRCSFKNFRETEAIAKKETGFKPYS